MRKKVAESTCLFGYYFFLNHSLKQTCATNPLPYPYCLYLLVNMYLSFKVQAKEFKLNLVSIESPRRFFCRDLMWRKLSFEERNLLFVHS